MPQAPCATNVRPFSTYLIGLCMFLAYSDLNGWGFDFQAMGRIRGERAYAAPDGPASCSRTRAGKPFRARSLLAPTARCSYRTGRGDSTSRPPETPPSAGRLGATGVGGLDARGGHLRRLGTDLRRGTQ